ncbi:hypothetical protein G6F37_006800 [Rhizopus arrhizus]|nr:hypothetical protein G6F38_006940 [Rhizopus arrhizus]KAG1157330.1 hypothetical protein G6F37_006800 [Rhizopus arrhizus]
MDSFSNLQDAFSELNINVPEGDDDQIDLLPQWKDITQFLDEATNDFKVGQLLLLKSFTLFEAMSAIEIMDPRMDTGALVKIAEPSLDISRQLSAEETLDIMDSLITREIAWLSGHSLSQTVYTCIYFHHIVTLNELSPKIIASTDINDVIYSALRVYILASVKCCHYIWMEMAQGNVYEEEDFTTNLFGLSFDNQLPDICVFDDLDTSIKHLMVLNSSPAIEAILNRIEIRKSYLLALIHLSQNDASNLTRAKANLKNVDELLKRVDLSLSKEVKGAFDPNINRKLTSQTPPRPVELESKEDSYKKYAQLIHRLLSICDVVDYSSAVSLMSFFDAFGSETPYADAFSRSKLNTILFHDQQIFGTQSISSLILRSIEEMVKPSDYWLSSSNTDKLPPETNLESFMHAHEMLKAFLERISMVKKYDSNNNMMTETMMPKKSEWQILEEEAAGIDELFHDVLLSGADSEMPYYFSSWAYHIKLTIMEKILFLGFELELYGQHEYAMILWYTRILLDSRNFLLSRIDQFIECESSYVRTQLYLGHATSALTEGLLRMAVTVEHTHQWNKRKPVFDDGMTRYLQRFKPFLNLASPPLPQYESYLATMDMGEFDIEAMKAAIKENLLNAKRLFNDVLKASNEEKSSDMCSIYSQKNITDILRTCVANDIGLHHIKQDGDKLSFSFKYHPWFPVLTK